jgi:nicotinamide mononucleotide adenylyltransferase
MPDAPPTLATLLARVEELCLFVGYDRASHAPLDEIVTLEERLRTIDVAVELMEGQLAEVLALLRATQEGR